MCAVSVYDLEKLTVSKMFGYAISLNTCMGLKWPTVSRTDAARLEVSSLVLLDGRNSIDRTAPRATIAACNQRTTRQS